MWISLENPYRSHLHTAGPDGDPDPARRILPWCRALLSWKSTWDGISSLPVARPRSPTSPYDASFAQGDALTQAVARRDPRIPVNPQARSPANANIKTHAGLIAMPPPRGQARHMRPGMSRNCRADQGRPVMNPRSVDAPQADALFASAVLALV